jgi:predicted kinase
VICLDELRREAGVDPGDADQSDVIHAAKEQAKTYLRSDHPFIWDATNLTRDMRRGIIALMANYGARTRIVYVEAPWEELHRRNLSRRRPVPQAVMDRLATRLEMPSPTEAHRIDYVTSASEPQDANI